MLQPYEVELSFFDRKIGRDREEIVHRDSVESWLAQIEKLFPPCTGKCDFGDSPCIGHGGANLLKGDRGEDTDRRAGRNGTSMCLGLGVEQWFLQFTVEVDAFPEICIGPTNGGIVPRRSHWFYVLEASPIGTEDMIDRVRAWRAVKQWLESGTLSREIRWSYYGGPVFDPDVDGRKYGL
jgi:hypothetical protein